MTEFLEDVLLAADFGNTADRLMVADLLEEIGRAKEAHVLRIERMPCILGSNEGQLRIMTGHVCHCVGKPHPRFRVNKEVYFWEQEKPPSGPVFWFFRRKGPTGFNF